MKKKLLLILTIFVMIITLTGCGKDNGKAFKEDYEKINGLANKSGKSCFLPR